MSSGFEIDAGGSSLRINFGSASTVAPPLSRAAGPPPQARSTYPGPRTADPLTGAYFSLSLDGEEIGSFTEITGLGATLDTEEVIEGGENGFVHRLPKALKWQNIVLKRGVTDSDALLSWMLECAGPGIERQRSHNYRIDRRSATITAHAADRSPVRGWRLDSALPVKWTGPTLAVTSKAAATEQLEVSHCGLSPAS